MRHAKQSAAILILTVFLLSQAAAETSAIEKSPVVEAYWANCVENIDGLSVDEFYRVQHFGRDAAMADLLVGLILSGEKTGLFSSALLTDGDRNATPVTGDYVVLTGFDGTPAAVWRTTSVKTLPFNEVTEEDTQLESPGARPLDVWRQIHWSGWARALEAKGRKPSEDMPITAERFELICTDSE
jgi:uncharacterized protein YhfF